MQAVTQWVGRVALAGLLLVGTGCNTSRYGVHYDQRLAGIKRVGVLAPSVKVFSLHTGGMTEERPDMAPAVQEAAMAAMQEEVTRCKRQTVMLDLPAPAPDRAVAPTVERTALLGAISDGIVTHHYKFGKERLIDYGSGDTPKVLGQEGLDTLLCVYVHGVVPTAGRQGLKATAIAMGVLTGIWVHVPTNQATVTVMLVDSKTGEILWFHFVSKEIKVSDKKDFRNLCKDACRYLLKPSK